MQVWLAVEVELSVCRFGGTMNIRSHDLLSNGRLEFLCHTLAPVCAMYLDWGGRGGAKGFMPPPWPSSPRGRISNYKFTERSREDRQGVVSAAGTLGPSHIWGGRGSRGQQSFPELLLFTTENPKMGKWGLYFKYWGLPGCS